MKKIIAYLIIAASTSGCTKDPFQKIDASQDFITPETIVRMNIENDSILGSAQSIDKPTRNKYITEKLFILDQEYAYYEKRLTRNEDLTKFFGSLATIGMSSAAAVLPLGATTKVLNTTITAVQGAETSIDQDLLQSQAIASIERQMRSDRNNQAAVIYNRMGLCSLNQYPIYVALSDLEAYRHYGTFESAIIGLGKTTSTVEAVSKDNKDNKTPDQAAKTNAALATLAPSPSKNPATICPISQ